MSIDASKTTPQAPRSLRVGSKGFGRALAASKEGKPPPDEEPDDDDEEEGHDEDAMSEHEPLRAAAEEAHTKAADAYAACKGSDSAALLMAADEAGDAAAAAHEEAKASSAKMRGAAAPDEEPGEDAHRPAPAGARLNVAGFARAIASASTTVEAQTKIAEAVAFADRMSAIFGGASLAESESRARAALQAGTFGAYALQRLGLSPADAVKAKGVLGAKLDLAAEAVTAKKSEAKTKAVSETARREKLWEDAVRDRRVQLAQAFARVDGPDGKPARTYSAWAKSQNAAYPEIAAFEAWISSRVSEPGARDVDPSTILADIAVDKSSAFALDERSKLEARRAGIDPDKLSAQLAQQQQNRGAQGAGERA